VGGHPAPAREVAVAILRVLLGTRGALDARDPAGKVRPPDRGDTYVLPFGSWADGLKLAMLVVAVALTLFTGAQYVAFAFGPVVKAPEEPAG
jgi:hypothetical protein